MHQICVTCEELYSFCQKFTLNTRARALVSLVFPAGGALSSALSSNLSSLFLEDENMNIIGASSFMWNEREPLSPAQFRSLVTLIDITPLFVWFWSENDVMVPSGAEAEQNTHRHTMTVIGPLFGADVVCVAVLWVRSCLTPVFGGSEASEIQWDSRSATNRVLRCWTDSHSWIRTRLIWRYSHIHTITNINRTVRDLFTCYSSYIFTSHLRKCLLQFFLRSESVF